MPSPVRSSYRLLPAKDFESFHGLALCYREITIEHLMKSIFPAHSTVCMKITKNLLKGRAHRAIKQPVFGGPSSK
jgi:hypothetical protein